MQKMIPLCILVLCLSLLLTADLAAEDLGGELMTKVMYNEPQQVAALLEKGADVNYRDPSSGSTPLMMACTYGFKNIAEMLIDHGAKVNLQADNGATALIGAARRHPKLVKLLLENGADVHIISAETGGPLTASIIHALTGGGTEIAELLLENGAKVDEAASEGRLAGYTPLIMAANMENLEVVRFLVERGADVNARAGDGATALKKAEAQSAAQIVRYLKEQGAR
jgi:ankyrin repeat protein